MKHAPCDLTGHQTRERSQGSAVGRRTVRVRQLPSDGDLGAARHSPPAFPGLRRAAQLGVGRGGSTAAGPCWERLVRWVRGGFLPAGPGPLGRATSGSAGVARARSLAARRLGLLEVPLRESEAPRPSSLWSLLQMPHSALFIERLCPVWQPLAAEAIEMGLAPLRN